MASSHRRVSVLIIPRSAKSAPEVGRGSPHTDDVDVFDVRADRRSGRLSVPLRPKMGRLVSVAHNVASEPSIVGSPIIAATPTHSPEICGLRLGQPRPY